MNYLKPVEHKIKAFFFALLRGLLKRGQRDFVPLDGDGIRRVLFLRPEKIGDMVISLPVFDGLRRHFPHIKIAILGSPTNHGIIRDDPRFDRIYIYRKNIFRVIAGIVHMRRGRYDCVVDMIGNDSVTALFLSQLCAPGKPRIGVGKVKYRDYYDFNYDHRRGNTGHIVENTLKLLEAFGIDSDTVSGFAEPYLTEKAVADARLFVASLRRAEPGSILVGYNLSAGSPTRLWADEKALALLNRIAAEMPQVRFVLITIPAERRRAIDLNARLNRPVHLVPDSLSLLQVAAIIKHLDLLITPDTSLVHIARAFRVPVVGLYTRYMKNFMLWRPYSQETGAVVSGNDDNIYDITPDQVFDVFAQVVREQNLVRP